MGLLKMYRAGQIEIEKLLTDLVDVVNGSKESDLLLNGFETFIPSKHRSLFDEVLRKQKQRSETNIIVPDGKIKPSVPVPDEYQGDFEENKKRRLHPDFIGKRSTISIEPVVHKRKLLNFIEPKKEIIQLDSHEPCPICKDARVNPFRAKCNHVACFNCLEAWLSRMLECPLCRQRTRVSQLRSLNDETKNIINTEE